MSMRFVPACLAALVGACVDGPSDGYILRRGSDASAAPEVKLSSCEMLPALDVEPVIDGRLEVGMAAAPFPKDAWYRDVTNDSSDRPDDVSARWAAAHGAWGLYVFVDIDTPRVSPAAVSEPGWCGDGVEIYVDHDAAFAPNGRYDDPGTRQLLVVAPTAAGTSRRGETNRGFSGSNAPWASTSYAAFARPGGYTVEALVTTADLGLVTWSLEEGRRIGFDLGLNVSRASAAQDVACGTRLGQFFLRATTTERPYESTLAFCAPTLTR